MSTQQNAGIDYGMGQTNIDHDTGIRYGVISARAVGETWYEQSEAQYGAPACPECGSDVVEYDDDLHNEYEPKERESWDYACQTCRVIFGSESAYPEEPQAFTYEGDGYIAEQSVGSYTTSDDIFITKSPYFTYAAFCSPCAPGAGYLLDAMDEDMGIKAYCFGHDWFWDTEAKRAPYNVYSVETGEIVEPEKKE